MVFTSRRLVCMGMDELLDDEPVWLTYADAAKRVRSSKHTIQLWRRNGMVMEWRVDEGGQRYRVVREDVLLAWWRDRMKASPVHFYRMRAEAIKRGESPPPVPDRFKSRRDTAGTARSSIPGVDSEHSQPPGVLGDPGGAGCGADRNTEALLTVLRELPEFVGRAEHAELMVAMENETPGCDGLEVFTYDRFADPEQTEMMRAICDACPLLDLCQAFAIVGRPAAGMWAGMTPAEIRRLGDTRSAA